ncbi:MAG: hypothetical protein ACLROG_03955 [Coprococcus phoceensis]
MMASGVMSVILIILTFCNAFRTALLNEMHSKIEPSFKKIKSKCYNGHKQGFYVYAKPNLSDSKTVIKYIDVILVGL